MNKRLAVEIARGLRAYSESEGQAEALAEELWPRLVAAGAIPEDRDHLCDALAGLFTKDEGRMEAALGKLSPPAVEVVMKLSAEWCASKAREEGWPRG